jgi:glycosyltransferase involved in cell wall biosynthesis
MQQNKFKIIIPSYNNEEWYEYNLASILNQTYTNYDVLYIDDCSTDSTYQKVVEVVGQLPNWTVVRNQVNKRRGYNVSPYNENISAFIDTDEDILVFVDGDDWLFEEDTLKKLNQFYNEHDVWMTYGQYVAYPTLQLGTEILHGTHYNSHTHKQKLYRHDHWRASHLRTFKWHLYKQIRKEDLVFKDTGEHYIYAEDLATSYPCMEMAGPNRIGVVDFITYVYNASDQNRARIVNDLERDPNGYEIEMKIRESEIRNRQPYRSVEEACTITSRLSGGLGNMLFQVASGYALALKNGMQYALYPEHVGTLHGHPRSYLDSIFAKLPLIESVIGFNQLKERGFNYTPFQPIRANSIIDGHFQSFRYFQEFEAEIKELFAPSNSTTDQLLNKYDAKNSVSLHVRRGDYLRLSEYHNNLSLQYYLNALDCFKNHKILVFSDDIDWCKANFRGDRFTFVEGQTELEDLYLMSLCAHNIIANSTFSWWGAMLNRNSNRQVICPDKWFGPLNQSLLTMDLYPPDWICLPDKMPEVTINLFDRSFKHLAKESGRFSSVHGKIPKLIKYTQEQSQFEGVTLFTDQYLTNPDVDRVISGKKVGWILESRQVDSTPYDLFSSYMHKFDFTLTHDQELLDKFPDKTRFTVFAGSWIKPQHYGIHPKTKNTSLIFSHKQFLEGHSLRHSVAEVVPNIDLFGTGCGKPIQNKEEALVDYRFSIVIENVRTKNYFTEKLVDCLLVGTIPIYWGCPNIGEFFDIGGLIIVDSLQDIGRVVANLTEKEYSDRYTSVLKNFELAGQYAVTEDWIYTNYFNNNEDIRHNTDLRSSR